MSDKPIVFNYKDYVRIREQLKQYDWIPIEDRLPEVGRDGYSDYILLSFDNADFICIGHYRVDPDGGGAFYDGDDDRSLMSIGLFVNAWMKLPKPYREEE